MSRTPSKYVGQQLRVLRERRRWRQADLVAELEQLGFPGWRQSKVAKIENGQAKRIPLEDVFESPPRSAVPRSTSSHPTPAKTPSGWGHGMSATRLISVSGCAA